MRNKQVKRIGFTLVELLVVIGIIALLVGILLPALNKARRSANTLKCSSNMRQLGLAMLSYITDNKGRFPIGQVAAANSTPYSLNGFYWANELVTQKYITAPNMYDSAGNLNLSTNSAFYCPECNLESAALLNGGTGPSPNYPADGQNSFYTHADYPNYPNTGQKFGIATWYMINIRNLSATNALNKTEDTPFVYYNGAADTYFQDPLWIRHMGLIKHSADVIMILESNNNNPCDQASAPAHYMRRLGARHGQKTADNTNAYTNFVFFDGHVALWPTSRFDHPPSGTTGFAPWHKDTIGYLVNQ